MMETENCNHRSTPTVKGAFQFSSIKTIEKNATNECIVLLCGRSFLCCMYARCAQPKPAWQKSHVFRTVGKFA